MVIINSSDYELPNNHQYEFDKTECQFCAIRSLFILQCSRPIFQGRKELKERKEKN